MQACASTGAHRLYRLFSYSYSYRINAVDIGGSRDGKPRQSSIFRIASGGLTISINLKK